MKTDLDSRLRERLINLAKFSKDLGVDLKVIDDNVSAIKDEFLKLVGEDTKAVYIDKAPLNTKRIKEDTKFRADVLNLYKAELRSLIKGKDNE